MFVKVRNGMRIEGGMVNDISMTGMGVRLHNTKAFEPGNYVEVHSEKLGFVNGFVRWVKPDRVGIQFDLTSNNSAKIASFFRYFHSDQ